MLQETVWRLRGVVPRGRVVVVAAEEFMPEIRRHLPRLPHGQLLVEPAARGTAPCIALAAEWIARRDPAALMAVFPSDHAVTDIPRFRRALDRALAVAAGQRCLVTFGVRPASADTGYGYIEVGSAVDRRRPRAHWVARFHEKPSTGKAQEYLRAGNFLWNSGMFVWRVDVIREAFAALAPNIAAAVAAIADAPTKRDGRRAEAAYRRLRPVSVDVAILEKAERVTVVEGDFGWSDVGSWAALARLWKTDAAGNATRGTVLLLDCRDTLVFGGPRMVAVVGMRDALIIDSPDAVLVCHKNRAQEVRRVGEEVRLRYPRFS